MPNSSHVTVLNVPMESTFGPSVIHPVLLKDQDGLTLVDTGMITQWDRIKDAIAEQGEDYRQIKRVILTHQDIDHIGNVHSLLDELPDTALLAHEDEIPYLTGDKPFIKMTPERISQLQGMMRQDADALLARLPDLRFVKLLQDGDVLPYGGGIQIIHTPGHTPGHISIYVPREGLLLAADELQVVDGELVGPMEVATPDMKQAILSLDKLLELEIRQILCYHGGLYSDEDTAATLRSLRESLR
ncbi:MBL fold metallo-hydrolase [Paenibacillus massiliensis]|uniref:MBL fold metallo-hydrolase n=1 Tax=Paenibacillus massiliensis TaxID=225917 RepID=UPI00042A68AA|nr:MBL fold metallo-hydrolase [Paenibacillus massiliensis]